MKKLGLVLLIILCFVLTDAWGKSKSGTGGTSSGKSRWGGSKTSSYASKSSPSKTYSKSRRSNSSAGSSSSWGGSASNPSKPSAASGGTAAKASHASTWGGASSSVPSADADRPQAPAKSDVRARNAIEEEKTRMISSEKSRRAMSDYKAARNGGGAAPVSESSQAKHKPANSMIAKHSYHYNQNDYDSRSGKFYSGWNQPSYANKFGWRYGMWDAVALVYMLDHIQDQQYAMMYYSHKNEPGMMAWRKDAETQAQNDPALRDKLDALDVRMQEMERQGVARDPNYVPPAMNDLAFSSGALYAAQKLNMARANVAPARKPPSWPFFLKFMGVLVLGIYLVFIRKY